MFRIALVTCLFLCTASAQAVPLPIYVLGGQSNMSGWGDSASLTGDLAAPQTDVLYLAPNAGFGYLRPYDDDFGPEMTFGRTLATSLGGPLAIVKHAVGSTSLAVEWNPDGGELYDLLLARTNMAKTYWGARGYEPYVAGFAWMQGEQDAKFVNMAEEYATRFPALVAAMREDYDAPEARFSYGLIRGGTYANRETVRAAQRAANIACERMYLAETDDLTTFEGLHFDTAAQLTLGERLAQPFLARQGGDADWDGDVDLTDLNIVRDHFGGSGPGDLDEDCVVDLDDLNAVRDNFGALHLQPVPEPASIVLALACVALTLARLAR